MTQQHTICLALTRRGWQPRPHARTSKYICMYKPGTNGFLYVGKAGALRFGPTVANSVPVDGFKRQMLAEGSRPATTN